MRIPTKFLLSHNSGSSDFIFSSCFRRENADYLIGNQRFVKVIQVTFFNRLIINCLHNCVAYNMPTFLIYYRLFLT
jgi:hypothetical protein